jgi:hypothetical protein
MDVLDERPIQQSTIRRCHVWRWSDGPAQIEWQRRTLLAGGLSKVGLLAGGATALVSASGNRRRRVAAAAAATPSWRYVTTGAGHAVDGMLHVSDDSGAVLSFDLRSAGYADSPQPGWLRFRASGSATWWSVEVK